jgi:hypothetical protein
MNNPRYPHQCVIYRKIGANSFNSNGEIKEVYNGPCRKSSSTNIRSFNTGSNTTGKVDIADYRVSIPGIVKGIQKGDLIDVTDLIGTEKRMRIVMVDATQLMGGGTAVLCNTSSN